MLWDEIIVTQRGIKMRKITFYALVLAISVMLTACGKVEEEEKNSTEIRTEVQNQSQETQTEESQVQNEENMEPTEEVGRPAPEGELAIITVKPDATHVKMLGRAMYEQDSNSLWMTFSGTGAEFEFYGTNAVIHFTGDSASIAHYKDAEPRVAVYVNGERAADVMLDQKETSVEVLSATEPCWNTVRVVKLSECANSTCGIQSIDVTAIGDVAPTPQKQYLVEIIGDSITCGYGVDDEDKDHHFVTGTEDVTKAYGYVATDILDVDYSMVSFSGFGVLSGYSADGAINTISTVPQYYKKMGFSYQNYEGKQPQNFDWNFEREPDVIVINLGTNDASYVQQDADRKAAFEEAYVSFIKEIRQCNPNSSILCILGIMGDDLYSNVVNAMNAYKDETGDTNIYNYKFATQSYSDGYAADWHPTAKTHKKAADKLAGKLASILGIENY